MSIQYKRYYITPNNSNSYYRVYYCQGGAAFHHQFDSIAKAKLFIDSL